MHGWDAIRQQAKVWSLIVALWGLLAFAFAGQLVFTAALTWGEALNISLRDWIPWSLLAPVTAWLAFRFPLERGKLAISIPVHIVACMLALLFCDLVIRHLAPQPVLHPSAPAHAPHQPVPPPPIRQLNQPERPAPPRDRLLGPPRVFFIDLFTRRAQFNLPIYWIVVSIAQALRYYRRSQERERMAVELESRLATAKLEALRMQLHPHFLFNTLNAISTLVHRDPNTADEMIANLSELLRATLDLGVAQEIPLRQELELTERYLQIQQVRLGARLKVRREIDVAALGILVPPMILQPLVENAVRHGIEPHPEPGELSVTARLEGNRLHLAVRDTGGGIKQGETSVEGIGLANTRARLRELYGSQARLIFGDGPGSGLSVEMELPARDEPRAPTSAPTPAKPGNRR